MLNEQESNSSFPTLSAFADLLKSGEPVAIDQLIESGILEVDDESADTPSAPPADRKPLWLWADELNAKHDARGTIRIVQPFSPADYQCQDEGLEALPDEQVTDLDGNNNYIVYRRAQGTSSDSDSATILLKRRVTDLTLKVACSVHGLGDRNIARLSEELDELRQELETERTERQGEVDALQRQLVAAVAEIRSVQSVDGCEIASAQVDISRLEQQLEDFENTFEPAPSPAVQWVRAIAFTLIGAALSLGAITASDYVNLSIPAQSVPTVRSR